MAELLVDLGNTCLKLGWLDEGLQYLGTIEDIGGVVSCLPASPERIWVSSVAGENRTLALIDALGPVGGELIRVGIDRYQQYLPTHYAVSQLGVDRWLAALAGFEHTGGECVVVDAGTATTIDLVDAQGIHLGGYILPGAVLMIQSIAAATAIRVPDNPSPCSSNMPGTTAEAIHCGSIQAQAALIEEVRHNMGQDCAVVIGGGGAEALVPRLKGGCQRVQQLVLEGLACLARREPPCAG